MSILITITIIIILLISTVDPLELGKIQSDIDNKNPI